MCTLDCTAALLKMGRAIYSCDMFQGSWRAPSLDYMILVYFSFSTCMAMHRSRFSGSSLAPNVTSVCQLYESVSSAPILHEIRHGNDFYDSDCEILRRPKSIFGFRVYEPERR